MSDVENYRKASQEGLEEAIKRVESFKAKPVLQMRIKQQISDQQFMLVCDVIDAAIRLLKAGAS